MEHIDALKDLVGQSNRYFYIQNDGQVYMTSKWLNFWSRLYVRSAKEESHPNYDIKALQRHMLEVDTDLSNSFALISRIEFQHGLMKSGQLNEMVWLSYNSLDIDHFHIELQSIFDYVACLLRDVNYKYLKDRKRPSFGKLRSDLSKINTFEDDSDGEISRLVMKCDWFADYNEIRNGNVHHGGRTQTFIDPGNISFQNYINMEGRIKKKLLMNNENVVEFRKYAVIALSRVILFLEELAILIMKRLGEDPYALPLNGEIGSLKVYRIGHKEFLDWSRDHLINSLN